MTPAEHQPLDLAADARLRSGTAARLAGVPVSTLRVWERRYAVVAAPKTATGQRLYTAHDVQRLRLMRQLTDRGHAIGTIAMLPLPALQALAQDTPDPPQEQGAPRVLVMGRAAAHKLRAAPGCAVGEVFDSFDALEARVLGGAGGRPLLPPAGDALLLHLPSLQPGLVERVLAVAAALPGMGCVVLYGFGTEALVESLRAAGLGLRREPASGRELARLVVATVRAVRGQPVDEPPGEGGPPPRRFSDEVLARIGELPSNVMCECPRHLSDLVMQVGAFERYSQDCLQRGTGDAALHRHLARLAGTARALFEQALERVAMQEQLPLDP
jgi:hypothetical protein